jgi:hypothetical protein
MGLEMLLIAGLVTTTAITMGQGSSAKMPTMPSPAAAKNTSKTAAPMARLSEQEKMNKRLAASQLTRDWGGVKLGKPGLLGLGGAQ